MSVEKRITDVSYEYAFMCKEANKFMDMKIHTNNLVYAKLKDIEDEPTVYIVTEENINDFENPIRVFSQRELEKLVSEPEKTSITNFKTFSTWVDKIKNADYLVFDSMEKLMLCYLMDKVYCRKWNKKEWIII